MHQQPIRRAHAPWRSVAATGLTLASLALAPLTLAACGGSDHGAASGATAAPGRTITVTMAGNHFEPTTLEVDKGETVKLRFVNTDSVQHEAMIGTEQAQTEHHQEMGGDGHTDDHGSMADSPDRVTVPPGGEGELVHTFDHDGSMLIGCHEPGHWEGGMRAEVQVKS